LGWTGFDACATGIALVSVYGYEKISKIGFVTNGCGPTIACASALTSLAKGKATAEACNITSEQLK